MSDEIWVAIIATVPTVAVVVSGFLQHRQHQKTHVKQEVIEKKVDEVYGQVNGTLTAALEKIRKLEKLVEVQQKELNINKED